MIMGLFSNALCAAEKFRRAAGTPDVEYGLECEIVSPRDLSIGDHGVTHYWQAGLGPLPVGTKFPRYGVGAPDAFPNLIQVFERDFWDGAGHEAPNLLASVDFKRALVELGIDTGANSPASTAPEPAPA
jgi:hypothetical protein